MVRGGDDKMHREKDKRVCLNFIYFDLCIQITVQYLNSAIATR
jgi:hypothetical protein